MQREILFRGQRADTKEWIEGSLAYSMTGKPMIMSEIVCAEKDMDLIELATSYINRQKLGWFYFVIPESVGQFTRLLDKNGKNIFEGDLLKWVVEMDGEIIAEHLYEVRYLANGKMDIPGFHFLKPGTNDWIHGSSKRFEVVGSIHDNPKLLNQQS